MEQFNELLTACSRVYKRRGPEPVKVASLKGGNRDQWEV